MASASGSLSNGLGTYSADEDDDYEVRVTTTSTRRTSGSRSHCKTPSASMLRKRFENQLERSKERFTPTPRRSIHTYKVTESTKRTATKLPKS